MNRQYTLPLPHQEMMGYDDFLSAPCNHEALQWIESWPDWPEPYLIIHGPRGSGKTHLAHLWQSKTEALMLSKRDLDTENVRKIVSQQSTLILDDAMTCVEEKSTQEALFHLLNIIREKGASLLMTALVAPAQWSLTLEDLRSRLIACPQVAIALPDETLLSAMMVKQFHDRQITINAEILDYLLPRIERSFSAVRSVVMALDKASLAEKRGITVGFVKRVLEEDHFLFNDPEVG